MHICIASGSSSLLFLRLLLLSYALVSYSFWLSGFAKYFRCGDECTVDVLCVCVCVCVKLSMFSSNKLFAANMPAIVASNNSSYLWVFQLSYVKPEYWGVIRKFFFNFIVTVIIIKLQGMFCSWLC